MRLMLRRGLVLALLAGLLGASGCVGRSAPGPAAPVPPAVPPSAPAVPAPAAQAVPTPATSTPVVPTKPAVTPADYFPAPSGARWEFAGHGNEYAAFSRTVQHVEGDRVQMADSNGGTVMALVFRITSDRIQRTLSRGEHYDGSSLLNQPASGPPVVVIQAPLQEGNAWESQPGRERREILAVGETLTVPAGTFADVLRIQVRQTGSTSVVEESYARGVGLVKVDFRDQEGNQVRSELKSYQLSPAPSSSSTAPAASVPTPQPAAANAAPAAKPAPSQSGAATPVAVAPKAGDQAPAGLQVELSPTSVAQGGFTVLAVAGLPTGAGVVQATAGDLPAPRFAAQGDRQYALLAVPAGARPGSRPLRLTWNGGNWEGTLSVVRRTFEREEIEMAEETAALLDDQRIAEETRLQTRLRSNGLPEPRWTGPFLRPVAGEVSSSFGLTRFANDRPLGQHTGIDITADEGVPVLASNSGRVLLARTLVITGHTVIIDHGAQLFSLYAHLSGLKVQEGQEVERSQTVGTVGSSGLATGPHLHWGMYVGNTPVDPGDLVGRTPALLPAAAPALGRGQ